MKLPKKVTIDGYEWKVIEQAALYGGRFITPEKTIIIGGAIKNEKIETFLHEIIEAILTTKGHRYSLYANGTNDRLLFSFYHHEFESIVKDIMLAIKDIIKN